MIQTIPVINNKGGVGKTTTAVNVAAGLARRGKRVLLVDLDPQGSASLSLGVQPTERSIAAALYGEVPFGMTVQRTHLPGLFLSPASPALADAGARLGPLAGRAARLREVLAPARRSYDHIVIDCAPSASLLSVNALVAADAFLVPVSPDYLSVQALDALDHTVRRVRSAMGQVAPVLGVVIVRPQGGDGRSESPRAALSRHYGGKLFRTSIGTDEALREAPILGVDVFEYAPESPGARDYDALTDEVVERLGRYSAVFPETGDAYVSAARSEAILEAVGSGDGELWVA